MVRTADNAVNPGEVLELAGGELILDGGTLANHGAIKVTAGATSTIRSASSGVVGGNGTITVELGATLVVDGAGNKEFTGGAIVNKGTLKLAEGQISFGDSYRVANEGKLYVSNGVHRDQLPSNAEIINDGELYCLMPEGGTINGHLVNKGLLALGDPTDKKNSAVKNRISVRVAQPTILLVSGSGTIGQPGSLFTTTIRSDYYGSLSSTGTITLNGGTLKYVLDPTTYLPPNADVFNILDAVTISGTDFGSFLPSTFRFDRQKTTVGGRAKYQLYSFN